MIEYADVLDLKQFSLLSQAIFYLFNVPNLIESAF